MDFVVASAVERSASEYIMTRSMVEGVGLILESKGKENPIPPH